MMYKNILVAYDGSEPSQEALVVAKDMIGDDPTGMLHVVSIIPVGNLSIDAGASGQAAKSFSTFFPDKETYEVMVEEAKKNVLDDMKDDVLHTLSDVACQVTIDVHVATKAAEGICEYAKDNSVDMIVMGRRGLSALRAMLGSVSYAVLHEAEIPVVTVR